MKFSSVFALMSRINILSEQAAVDMAEAGLPAFTPTNSMFGQLSTSSPGPATPASTATESTIAPHGPKSTSDRTAATATDSEEQVAAGNQESGRVLSVPAGGDTGKAQILKRDVGGGGGAGEGKTAEESLSCAAGEWAAVLALFNSNLCFATEGPGRVSDYQSSDDDEGHAKQKEVDRSEGVGDEASMIARCYFNRY